VAVTVALAGLVSNLTITLLDPSDDDAMLTGSVLVTLSTTQRRNLIGSSLSPSSSFAACQNNFRVLADPSPLVPIRDGYFRNLFRHEALGIGPVTVISNGENVVATLEAGEVYLSDHRLMGNEDMPDPVAISFEAVASATESASDPNPRYWHTMCEFASTAFVLYRETKESANFPLTVLRVDGAGDEDGFPRICSYDRFKLGKFDAELSLYNAVPDETSRSFVFGIGVSQFLPRANLADSDQLAYKQADVKNIQQPGEIYVRLFDLSGKTVVNALRVAMHAQRRNFVGVSKDANGAFQLEALQPAELTATGTAVPPQHFRLLFVHSALGLPMANLTANDDIRLLEVPPGTVRAIDHPLIAPHEAGQLLKLSLSTSSSTSTSILVDLSELCDGAAYASILVGTPDQADLYDPTLMRVDGTRSRCSLPPTPVHSGNTSTLTMVNLQPSDGRVVFNWGPSVLMLQKFSIPLIFGQSAVTEVPHGKLFMRLLRDELDLEQLVPPAAYMIVPQQRNIMVSVEQLVASNFTDAIDGGGGATAESTVAEGSNLRLPPPPPPLPPPPPSVPTLVRFLMSTARDEDILGGKLRMLLLNALRGGSEAAAGGPSADATAHFELLGSNESLQSPLALASLDVAAIELPSAGILDVSFDVGVTDEAYTLAAQLSLEQHCTQSVQLVALAGRAQGEGSGNEGWPPRVVHIDSASQGCTVFSPDIPEEETVPDKPLEAVITEVNYDVTGLGSGPFSGASRRHGPSVLAMSSLALATAMSLGLQLQRSGHQLAFDVW